MSYILIYFVGGGILEKSFDATSDEEATQKADAIIAAAVQSGQSVRYRHLYRLIKENW